MNVTSLKKFLEAENLTEEQIEAIINVQNAFPTMFSLTLADQDEHVLDISDRTKSLSLIALKNSTKAISTSVKLALVDLTTAFIISHLEHIILHADSNDKDAEMKIEQIKNAIFLISTVAKEPANIENLMNFLKIDDPSDYVAKNLVEDAIKMKVGNVYHPCATHPHPLLVESEKGDKKSSQTDGLPKKLVNLFKNAAKA